MHYVGMGWGGILAFFFCCHKKTGVLCHSVAKINVDCLLYPDLCFKHSLCVNKLDTVSYILDSLNIYLIIFVTKAKR